MRSPPPPTRVGQQGEHRFMSQPPPPPPGGGGGGSSQRHHHHTNNNYAASSAMRRRQDDVRAVQSLKDNFEALDEFDIDATAADAVAKFMRRSGQQAEVVVTHARVGHYAMLEFNVGAATVKAVGQSVSKKGAIQMCQMHALRLVEYYRNDDADADNAPRPLRLTKATEHPTLGEKPPPPKKPPLTSAALRQGIVQQKPQPSTDPPPQQSRAQEVWSRYVAACDEYVAQVATITKRTLLLRLMTPPSGDPLADASAATTQFQSMNYSAVERLVSVTRSSGYGVPPAEEWLTVTIGPGAKMCTLPLPQYPWLEAIGVGRNKHDARVRAAMHASHMLEVAEKAFGGLAKHASARFQQRGELQTVSVPSHVSSSVAIALGSGSNDVIRARHTDEAKSRLIELYTVCLDLPIPVSESDTDRRTGVCVARVKVGDYACVGRGLNKEDAERQAYHALYEELTANDAVFRDIVALLETHPHLDPEHVVKLQLSSRLAGEIEDLVEGADFSGEDTDTSSTHVDPTTRKLLGAIGPKTEAELAAMSEVMATRLKALHADPTFQAHFLPKQQRLAMVHQREALLNLVRDNRVVIVSGTTGCGKTTQVPQFLLDEAIEKGEGPGCSIVVTQPRRISAVSIAQRIAAERLEKIGATVGYTIRLESHPGSNINLCTTGVLLQMFLGSPNLEGLRYLIVDEIHERDINCDFTLIMVKELLARNSKVKVILMSATLQSDLFSSYFDHAPVLRVDGQTFPVEEFYLDTIANIARQRGVTSFMTHSTAELDAVGTFEARRVSKMASRMRAKDFDYNLLRVLLAHVIKNHNLDKKSVLVFLPGWKEIMAARKMLEADDRYHFVLLHSSVDSREQMRCFEPAPEGKFKIILSTNIAESGVTIDDVAAVLDAGTIKEMSWVLRSGTTNVGRNSLHGLNTLVTAYASRANCIQRRGRSGRTQGGVCYRFYTREHFASLPEFQVPEMHRQPLDAVILRMMAMGYTDPASLLRRAIEPPSDQLVRASLDSLKALGAVDSDTKLTSLGRWLSKLPTTPRTGKMIMLGAVLKCLDSVLTLAAAVETSPFVTSREQRREVRERRLEFAEGTCSDHIAGINAFNGFSSSNASQTYCNMNLLTFSKLNIISKYKRQFYEILGSSGFLDRALLVDTELRRSVRDARDNPIPFVEVSAYSQDARNVGLVKSVICAALFPNVALQNTTRSHTKEKVLRTKLHNHLVFGKDSVAYRAKGDEVSLCPYFVYDEMMLIADSNTEFMSGVTAANMWAILLLGASPSHVAYRDDLRLGVIDDWIIFQSNPETVENILKLKKLLHHCIWTKFKSPDDAANNDRLDRIQRICKELFDMPLKPNEFAGEWKQQGVIVSPFPPGASPQASNATRVDEFLTSGGASGIFDARDCDDADGEGSSQGGVKQSVQTVSANASAAKPVNATRTPTLTPFAAKRKANPRRFAEDDRADTGADAEAMLTTDPARPF